MVTVFLRGGLGNQMFQYALGVNLAKKNGTGLLLDTVHLRDRFPRPNFSYRTFDLDVFVLEPRLTALSRAANAFPIPGAWLGIDLFYMELSNVLGTRKIIREKSQLFDPMVIDARGELLLFGRWQSEKYFLAIKDEMQKAFSFRHPFTGVAADLAGKIGSTNSVSLHVRRGDFAAFKNVTEMMGETDLGYYSRAAKYIGEHVSNPQFFVFSDDIEWCKANIKLPFPITFVDDASRGPKASWHMALMSLCKHNIIANSTFSWWAAWLNKNGQKIVVAPRKWYADGRGGDEDIVPEAWVRL